MTLDYTGRKFGRLEALELDVAPVAPNRPMSERYMATRWWKCRCECGNVKTISRIQLSAGTVKSCGCLSKELSRERLLKWKAENGR